MAIYRRKTKDGSRSGSYRIAVYKGKDENGKKLWHFERFDGNIQQARDRETQIKYDLKHGTYTPPSKETVGEYLDRWLKDYAKPNTAPNTYRGYEQKIRCHIKPGLGNILLTSLTKSKIASYYSDRLNNGLSPQEIKHHHTCIHKAFETAIEWELLKYNPSDNVTPPPMSINLKCRPITVMK